MKKISIIFLILVCILVTGCTPANLEYTYEQSYEPGAKFEVVVDYKNDKATVNETRYCSTEGCEPTKNKYEVTLTSEIEKLIQKIAEKEDYSKQELTENLIYLQMGDEEITAKEGNNNWDSIFKAMDTNNDESISCYEYGLNALKEMAK